MELEKAGCSLRLAPSGDGKMLLSFRACEEPLVPILLESIGITGDTLAGILCPPCTGNTGSTAVVPCVPRAKESCLPSLYGEKKGHATDSSFRMRKRVKVQGRT